MADFYSQSDQNPQDNLYGNQSDNTETASQSSSNSGPAENFGIPDNTPKMPPVMTPPKRKRKHVVLTTILTVLLAIMLFMTSAAAIGIYGIRNAVSSVNAEELINNIDIAEILSDVDNGVDLDLDRFYEFLEEEHQITMNDEDIERFIKKSTVVSYISDKLSDFVEDFFEDDAELEFSRREIVDLIEDNNELIYDMFDRKLTEEEVLDIADWVVGEDGGFVFDTDSIKDEMPSVYTAVNVGLSYTAMWILAGISFAIVILMLVNSVSQGFCGTGIVLTIIGVIISFLAVLTELLSSVLKSVFGNSIVSTLVGNILAINKVMCVSVLGAGIFLIIAGSVIKRLLAKKNTRA